MPNCVGDTSSCKEQKRVVCYQVTQEPQTSSTAKELDTPTLWRASLDSDPAAWDPIAAVTQECPRGMTSTLVYLVLVLLMICNRNGITSVGRGEFVKVFVEDFVAILVAIHFATPFATKNDRENFVEISSKISLLQLKFDEISTKFWTKFRRFFLWQNVVAKRFATRTIFVKT